MAAFMRRHAQYLASTVAGVLGLWDQLPDHNRGDLDGWLESVVPLVERQQQAAGPLVDGYVAKLAGTSPVGVTGLVDLRGGVSTAEVYERPFLRAWKLMGEGVPREVAVDTAKQYVGQIAQMDGQLAVSHAMAEVTDRHPQVVGYRRVLTGASCRFCAAASTRRYRARELRPLHTHCDCGVAPIFGDRDPGQVVNEELLDNLKQQGPKYWAKRGFVDVKGNPLDPTDLGGVRTGRNPELGPVLVTA